MNNIKDKLVLITGASSGIGEAAAVRFAQMGARLILTARRVDRLEKLASTLNNNLNAQVSIHSLDVTDRAAVKAFTDGLTQAPDILVNNAGLSRGKDRLFEADVDDWEEMIDTNVKGVLYVTRGVLPLMVAADKGHVINIGSIAGEEVYAGGNVYNMTKFAVKALSLAMGLDLAETCVRVSNIAPGAVNTEFSTVRYKGDTCKADATYTGFTPLSAEDIADAIIYVANSPEHVNIQQMVILPTAQRSSTVFRRR